MGPQDFKNLQVWAFWWLDRSARYHMQLKWLRSNLMWQTEMPSALASNSDLGDFYVQEPRDAKAMGSSWWCRQGWHRRAARPLLS